LDEKVIHEFHRIQQELLDKERQLVIRLRNDETINDEALRKIEYELDLEETRLILERGL
jgi:CPA1 family monovalent cation:H+ antiporter